MDIKKMFEMHKPAASMIAMIAVMLSTETFAAPHFYLQMINYSNKETKLTFQKGVGNVFLAPTLADKTPLAPKIISLKYEVHIEPLDEKSTFNIIFTGKQDCTFNVAFYAPGNPKITMSGPGCYGGGYLITDNGYTLALYVTDINKQTK